MSVTKLRAFTVWSSLGLTGGSLLFFIIAPHLGYPMSPDDAWKLAQISTPVFMGFLGTVSQFLINGPAERVRAPTRLLGALVVGPFVIYLVTVVSLVAVFGWGNRTGQDGLDGLHPDLLTNIYTFLLGILAISSNIATGILFRSGRQ